MSGCATCGTQPREGDKFCHECGAPVTVASKPAEYKQVTVLFADVVRSMDIAAAVGAERLREIMAELVTHSSAIVQRYSGTVDKFTGDGIMAVFGAPIALEDHAFRACLTALEIQAETQRLAVEVQHHDNITLQLRIGLNSGQVIAGEIGAGPLGYTAIGEQVGMAQRMESVAPPGGVMLSETTARLVGNTALLGDPEMVHIKGSEQPVSARRLLGIGGQQARRRGESPLVGRTWELNTITGILDEAINGAGCVVGVVGPAGIGKSRLVRESAAIAASRGVPVFGSYCESHASDIPFHVVARLLRGVMGVEELDDATAIVQQALGILDDRDEWAAHLRPDAPTLPADEFHPWVWEAAQTFWASEHYRAAVDAAATAINAHTQNKVGRRDVANDDLMNQVFTEKPRPGQVYLRLPGDPSTDQTLKSRNNALRPFAAGCFAGIRNPASHEHGDDWDQQKALEYLASLSVLARWIDECRSPGLLTRKSECVTIKPQLTDWHRRDSPLVRARALKSRASEHARFSRICGVPEGNRKTDIAQ